MIGLCCYMCFIVVFGHNVSTRFFPPLALVAFFPALSFDCMFFSRVKLCLVYVVICVLIVVFGHDVSRR